MSIRAWLRSRSFNFFNSSKFKVKKNNGKFVDDQRILWYNLYSKFDGR